MDELLAQFLIEGRDLIAQASADLDSLARDPSVAAPAAIDSAFRAIHTLKGSVGIFPMGPAEQVLHAAEDVLERARKGEALDDATIAALVACIDLTDRWIDEIERSGALEAGAEATGAAAIARLPRDGSAAVAVVSQTWLAPLAERERAVLQGASEPLVAFRYTPDAECFFRGDDPLTIVAAVPDLVALAILPAEGAWPALDALEPFQCVSVLEGLSSAPLDAVRGAFRLVTDQAAFHVIEPRSVERIATEGSASSVLRVEASRIDALADGLGELIVAANALAPIAEDAERVDRALAARIRTALAEIEGRIGNLHRSVSRVRLMSLAPTLRRLPRMAREIAEGLGKRVNFTMSGEGIEVDKQIADGLFEPLLHLVRNAIDHGIEDAGGRSAAGKPAEGQVTLAAKRDGDAILLSLSDDGAGIDPERIRAAAITRGLVSLEAAEQLSDAAALRLIFAPGFSTARQTTEISGRGVGMDAVQSAIEKLRGTVEVESTRSEGTHFRLCLPANALTTRLLVITVGEDRYGVALDQIVETVRIGEDALMPVGDGTACVLRGKTVPVLSLATLLGGAQTPAPHAKLLVTRSGGARVALRVDGFAERIDTVVRPLSGLLASVPGVTGSALLGDGGVLLVLDLPELAA